MGEVGVDHAAVAHDGDASRRVGVDQSSMRAHDAARNSSGVSSSVSHSPRSIACQRGSLAAFSSSIGTYSLEWRSHSATPSLTVHVERPACAATGAAVWLGAAQRAGVDRVERLGRRGSRRGARPGRDPSSDSSGSATPSTSSRRTGRGMTDQQQLHHRLDKQLWTRERRSWPRSAGERAARGARRDAARRCRRRAPEPQPRHARRAPRPAAVRFARPRSAPASVVAVLADLPGPKVRVGPVPRRWRRARRRRRW